MMAVGRKEELSLMTWRRTLWCAYRGVGTGDIRDDTVGEPGLHWTGGVQRIWGNELNSQLRVFSHDCGLLLGSTLSNHLLLRTTVKNKQIQLLHEMIQNILQRKVKAPSVLPWQTDTREIWGMQKPQRFTQSSCTTRAHPVGQPCKSCFSTLQGDSHLRHKCHNLQTFMPQT